MTQLSRRRFLQLGLAGAVTLVLENRMADMIRANELVEGGSNVSRTTGLARVGIPSICSQCQARCGILGFVEEGRLVKIEGNPRDPNNRGKICARGQAGINYAYNPDRILYPLKRVGQRGQGKWKRIDWDEAYAEVGAMLKTIREGSAPQVGDPNQLVFIAGFEGKEGLTNRFLRAFGTSSVLLEQAVNRANRWVGQELTWGASFDIPDAANTKYILNFGANPYESHSNYVPLIQRIIDGRMTGARLITLDPRLSHTAGKSDQWLPIKPGTDAVVALAMASIIMQRGLYDRDFIETWINHRPDLLANHLSQFTPEMAEQESGIRATDIVKLAMDFAMTKPAVAIAGGGIYSHSSGVQTQRAIMLLNAITGNIDVRGGSCLPRTYDFYEPDPMLPTPATVSKLARPTDFPLATYSSPQKLASMIKAGDQKVGVLMTAQANPVFTFPESENLAAVLKDESLVPHFVAIDSYITETAALADIILPAATYLESWGIDSPPSYQLIPQVSLRQPVIKPLGESVPVHDMFIELANRIGGGMEEYFGLGTADKYIEAGISRIEGLSKAGGMNYLKANGVWADSTAQVLYRSYEKGGGFNTPSRKFEVLSKRMDINGLPALPVYEKPQGLTDAKDGSLVLVVFQSSGHNDSTTAASIWINEITHNNPIWINADVAKAKGIKKGDKVRIASPAGTIVATAMLSQGIHPSIVAIGSHGGHWEYGRVAKGEKFDSKDPNTKLIWWEKEGNGTHVQGVVPVTADRIGGGQAWTDITVAISRV